MFGVPQQFITYGEESLTDGNECCT